jgi:hypothetical protein
VLPLLLGWHVPCKIFKVVFKKVRKNSNEEERGGKGMRKVMVLAVLLLIVGVWSVPTMAAKPATEVSSCNNLDFCCLAKLCELKKVCAKTGIGSIDTRDGRCYKPCEQKFDPCRSECGKAESLGCRGGTLSSFSGSSSRGQ